MRRLEGKVAIVTGGALGIGGATARRVAAEGASVLVADVMIDDAEANVGVISDAGGTAAAIQADVADAHESERMIEHAVERWGRLDILVQNAFSPAPDKPSIHGSAVDLSEEGWDWGMGVLAKALFLGAKHAVPHMRATGGGNIINISSVHGLLQSPDSLLYEAGKTAVIGMTRQMACDFGPDGIRVNAICPGLIVTERGASRWEGDPGGPGFFAEQYPLRRTGVPDDIAGAVAFLCSADASFITGHALVVDGGLTIQLQEDVAVRMGRYAREHLDAQLRR